MITINGKSRPLDGAISVKQLLLDIGLRPDGLAVAINLEIAPRGEWESRQVRDGDSIEIVHMVGGGAGQGA